jgi:hypothetical protein
MNMLRKELMLQKQQGIPGIPINASLCQIHRLCEFDTDVQKVEFTDTDVTVTLVLNMLTHKCTPPNQAILFHSKDNVWHFTICNDDDLMEIPIEHSYESGKFYTTTFMLPRFDSDIVRIKMDYNKYNCEGPANYLVFDWIKEQVCFECNYFMPGITSPNYVTQIDPNNSPVEEIVSKNKSKKTWFSNLRLLWHSDDPKIYNITTKVVSYMNPKKPYVSVYDDDVIEVDI